MILSHPTGIVKIKWISKIKQHLQLSLTPSDYMDKATWFATAFFQVTFFKK